MKLKEKLAHELLNEETDSLMSSFIKGYDKARERAIEIHMECGAAMGCCNDEISRLGEEEVNES